MLDSAPLLLQQLFTLKNLLLQQLFTLKNLMLQQLFEQSASVQVSTLKNQLAQVQAERDSLQKQLLMSDMPIGPPELTSEDSATPSPRLPRPASR
jgi:hypothetical protein